MLAAHISFSLGLIALVIGLSLFLWSLRAEPGPGIALAKAVGIIVFILAILQLIFTIYSGIRYKGEYCKGRKGCDHCPMKNQSTDNSPVVAPSVPQSQPYTAPQNPSNTPSNNTSDNTQ